MMRSLGFRSLLSVVAAAVAVGVMPSGAAASTQCPWLNSQQSIARRVAEVMGKMTVADEIDLVEGHGSSNPYVFYEPAIPGCAFPSSASRTAQRASPTSRLASPSSPPACRWRRVGTRRWRFSTAR
jgi:hypothetical protein